MNLVKRRGEKLLVLTEAFLRSLYAFVLVEFSSKSRLARVLGEAVMLDGPELSLPAEPLRLTKELHDIMWAHEFLERISGNRLTCLMRSLSARSMLKSKGIPAVLILGVCRGDVVPGERFDAHAWVDVSGQTVLGAWQKERHVPVAAFVERSECRPESGARA
jgi:hypothetical protein